MSRNIHFALISANCLIQFVKIKTEGYPIVMEQFTLENVTKYYACRSEKQRGDFM